MISFIKNCLLTMIIGCVKTVRIFGWKIGTGGIIVVILSIIFIPYYSYSIGNLFFGRIKPLYNLKLAHIFYSNASYPILPVAPPEYAHYQLSRTYFIQGNLSAALEEANKELEIYPDNTKTYYILGLIYGYMHQPDQAIDAFSKYIDNHPETWAGRNDKAWLQFRIGDIKGALETIKPVAEKDTTNAWVQNTYCALLISNKNYPTAKDACLNAKNSVEKMSESNWGEAYPGNDPRVYGTGLSAMKTSIDENLKLIDKVVGGR